MAAAYCLYWHAFFCLVVHIFELVFLLQNFRLLALARYSALLQANVTLPGFQREAQPAVISRNYNNCDSSMGKLKKNGDAFKFITISH